MSFCCKLENPPIHYQAITVLGNWVLLMVKNKLQCFLGTCLHSCNLHCAFINSTYIWWQDFPNVHASSPSLLPQVTLHDALICIHAIENGGHRWLHSVHISIHWAQQWCHDVTHALLTVVQFPSPHHDIPKQGGVTRHQWHHANLKDAFESIGLLSP